MISFLLMTMLSHVPSVCAFSVINMLWATSTTCCLSVQQRRLLAHLTHICSRLGAHC